MAVHNKDFKIKKRTLVLSFVIFSLFLVSFHNLNIIMMYNTPEPAPDGRLSSIVIQNGKNSGLKYDLYDRITDNSVLSEFIILAKKYYGGRDVIIKKDLISEKILRVSGFKRIITSDNHKVEVDRENEFLEASETSLWYNPLVFCGKGYVKTGRYPFKTEPVFEQDYPYTILFIKENGYSEEPVSVFECGRYLVFSPGSGE